MRSKPIEKAVMVLANGKVARGWRKRRVRVVLGKRGKREMKALLERWDRLLEGSDRNRSD